MDDMQMKRLIRWMRKSNPVRQIAERVLAGEIVFSAGEVERLLISAAQGSEIRRNERTVAMLLLHDAVLNSEQAEHTAGVLGRIATGNDLGISRRTIKRFAVGASFTAIAGTVLLAGLEISEFGVHSEYFTLHNAIYGIRTCLFFSILLSFVTIPIYMVWAAYLNNELRITAINTLGKYQRISSIGLLADIARRPDLYASAANALSPILATVRDEQCGYIGSSATLSLCRLLDRAEDTFRILTLNALGKAGDGSAVDAVKRLAENTTNPEVRQAALDAIPLLEARKRNKDAQRLLLRPSTAPGDSTLLRPAANAPAEDEALLLRPAEGED